MSEHNTVENGDALIERARAEIRAQAATLRERPLLERQAPQVARDERIDQQRLAYRIAELTDAHHRAFVEQAFHALLKREPTPIECDAMLALLAAGVTKAEALGNLRWSPEGRAIGARVAGLAPRYAMAKLRRVPLLGYLLDIPLNLAALPALARHQRASDAMLAAGDATAAQAARELGARIEALDAHALEQALAQQRLDAAVHEGNVAHAALTRRLGEVSDTLRARIEALEHLARSQRARIETLEHLARSQRARLDDLEIVRRQLHGMNRWRDALDGAFARIDDAAAVHEQRQAQAAEPLAQAMLQTAAPPYAAWGERLARRLAPGSRVLVAGADAMWSRALVGCGLDAIETGSDDVQARWSRCADASVDAASVLALPVTARAFALPTLLAEIRRVVVPGGAILLAFARDAVTLRSALRGESAAALDVELVALALAKVGCEQIERIDADGVPALLARQPAA